MYEMQMSLKTLAPSIVYVFRQNMVVIAAIEIEADI